MVDLILACVRNNHRTIETTIDDSTVVVRFAVRDPSDEIAWRCGTFTVEVLSQSIIYGDDGKALLANLEATIREATAEAIDRVFSASRPTARPFQDGHDDLMSKDAAIRAYIGP